MRTNFFDLFREGEVVYWCRLSPLFYRCKCAMHTVHQSTVYDLLTYVKGFHKEFLTHSLTFSLYCKEKASSISSPLCLSKAHCNSFFLFNILANEIFVLSNDSRSQNTLCITDLVFSETFSRHLIVHFLHEAV